MKSSGITLIAEEHAAQRRRARVRALGWIVAVALSLGAIYASGDAIDASVSGAFSEMRSISLGS
jgi:ferric-dicitrate binding protein FerR (iron transport regulator)